MPKSESARLNREVKRIFTQETAINPFQLVRLEQEAQKIWPSEPLLSLLLRARIACLRFDLSNMHQLFQMRIDMLPGKAAPHIDYALALRKLGFYSDSLRQVRLAGRLAPQDLGILQNWLRASVLAGRYNEALKAVKHAFETDSPLTSRQYNFIYNVAEILRQNGIDDDHTETLQQRVISYLHRRLLLFPTGTIKSPAVHMNLITGEGFLPSEMETMETVDGGCRETERPPVEPAGERHPSYPYLFWQIQLDQPVETILAINNLFKPVVYTPDELLPEKYLTPLTKKIRLEFIPLNSGTFNRSGFFS